jgi:hypothetical protein
MGRPSTAKPHRGGVQGSGSARIGAVAHRHPVSFEREQRLFLPAAARDHHLGRSIRAVSVIEAQVEDDDGLNTRRAFLEHHAVALVEQLAAEAGNETPRHRSAIHRHRALEAERRARRAGWRAQLETNARRLDLHLAVEEAARQPTVIEDEPHLRAIEQVLVDRVAACWVQANYFDATEATHGDRTFSQAELALKRQTMAHKRLLSALKTLAEVRRLMTPTVQVNIAEQQVNLASAGPLVPA